MKIVKNWLPKELAFKLRTYLLNQAYTYNSTSLHSSQGTKKTFFVKEFNLQEDLGILDIAKKIGKLFNHDISVLRAYANLQFTKMDGEWHTDDGQTTCLWMATKSLPKGSGELEIEKQKIKFDFNKLIMFNAKLKHRGKAPKAFNTPRITLAFKTVKYD